MPIFLPKSGILDSMLDIPAGNIPGYSGVNKFGRNPNIASGATEEIWDGSATYYFPTTTEITTVGQAADQLAMRDKDVEIQGLDANWDLTVQTATLNATDTSTTVAITTPLIRVFRVKVMTNVVTDQNVVISSDSGLRTFALALAGNNQTLMAIYTVPNDKTAYMTSWYTSVNPATNLDPTAMPIRLWARDNDNSFEKQIKHIHGIISGHVQHFYQPYNKFTQKTDLWFDATPTGKAADVSTGFDLILRNN